MRILDLKAVGMDQSIEGKIIVREEQDWKGMKKECKEQ